VVPDIGRAVDEVVISLADDRNELIEIFLATARSFSLRTGATPGGTRTAS